MAPDWPVLLANTLKACLAHGTRLIYFDNVYAYARVDAPMTESTPIQPSSAKGALRAALLGQIEDARAQGLNCTVARSADFYGPGATTSAFNSFVVDKVAAGKTPSWLFDADQPHSMTYTQDIGTALAVLGTDGRGQGGMWHLPTATALTGREYLALASGGRARFKTVSIGTMRMGAIFVPIARETLELSYQNTRPYRFESGAFQRTFGLTPTPYRQGIAASVERARRAAP